MPDENLILYGGAHCAGNVRIFIEAVRRPAHG